MSASLLAALLICAIPASAADPAPAPEIAVRLAPESPEVGLVMTVTVSVAGAEGADCALVGVPAVDGARLSPPMGPQRSSSTEIINGRMRQSVSTSWLFELIPEREGLLTLPPFRLECRGVVQESAPRTVAVGPTSLVDDLVRMSVVPSSTEAWVGQVLDVEVELAVLETAHDLLAQRGLELHLPWLEDQPGLHTLEIPVPPCSRGVMIAQPSGREVPTCTDRRREDGRQWILYRQAIPVLATEAGRFDVPASRFSARVVVERGDPLSGLLGGLRQAPTRTMVTDAVAGGFALTVREPPLADRPAWFTNAVGRFRLGGEARPTTLRVGESCRLRLTLAPDGLAAPQIARIAWPDHAGLLTGFRLFSRRDETVGGQRVLELELSPLHEGVTQVPALPMAWFDPTSGRYETASFGPVALSVSPGGSDGLADLLPPEEILNDLETIRETLPAPRPTRWPSWAAPVAAGALLALVEVRRAVRRWRADHPELLARRAAPARLERQLRQAADVRAVAAAFARYLATRFGGPPAGLTAEEAGARLADRGLARELQQVVSRWEAAYLGGATLELESARQQARELAARLEDAR